MTAVPDPTARMMARVSRRCFATVMDTGFPIALGPEESSAHLRLSAVQSAYRPTVRRLSRCRGTRHARHR